MGSYFIKEFVNFLFFFLSQLILLKFNITKGNEDGKIDNAALEE